MSSKDVEPLPMIDGEEISYLIISNAKCLKRIWMNSKEFDEKTLFDDLAKKMVLLWFAKHQRENPAHFSTLFLKDYSKQCLQGIYSAIKGIPRYSTSFLWESDGNLTVSLKIKDDVC